MIMRKLLSGFIISSVIILACVMLDVNQRLITSAHTLSNVIQGAPLKLSEVPPKDRLTSA